MSEFAQQARLVRWLRNDGEVVHRDEPICEIETDKATVEVPSPGDGILRQLAEVGDLVTPATQIFRLDPRQ